MDKEKCTHPVRATDFLGALTNTDWHCTVCGEYVGPQSGRQHVEINPAAMPQLETLMPKDMSEAKRIITQLYGELSTTKALLNAELQRNKGV